MRILPVSLLLASLALPAAAQSRFGLGLDLLFEHQESLEVSAFRGTILTRDLLNGGEQAGEQSGDPALLNRKFDLVWELEGTGVELPIELPGFGGLNPKLVLQAGVADVSLDFIGLRDRRDDAALSGRGPLFGAELEVEGSLFGSSPLSWSGSLRWQKLPSLTVDRSPAFRPEGFEVTADGVELSRQGFEVMGDEVRLSQEVQELTARVGYNVFGETKYYLGVRHRWTELEIEDELGYVDPLREIETRLASHTDLESDTTLAVAGTETWFGNRLYGRMETAFSEGDWMVLAKVLYIPGQSVRPPPQREVQEIAGQISQIRLEFVQSIENLPMIVDLNAVRTLLDRTEASLLAALSDPYFAAMRDYVFDLFQRARERLVASGRGAAAWMRVTHQQFAPSQRRARRSVAKQVLISQVGDDLRKENLLEEFASLMQGINLLIKRLGTYDIKINVCLVTEPQEANVDIRPPSYTASKQDKFTNVRLRNWPRGLYAYTVTKSGYETVCPPEEECAPLDLLQEDRPFIRCILKSESKIGLKGRCYVQGEPDGRRRCGDSGR